MSNISNFYGCLKIPKKSFELISIKNAFEQFKQVSYNEIQYGIVFENNGYLVDENYVYPVIGKGRWSFDLSVDELFYNYCDYKVYQQFLSDLKQNNFVISFDITEYEVGVEILDNEIGTLDVIKDEEDSEKLKLIVNENATQYENYAFTVKNRVKYGKEPGESFDFEKNEMEKGIKLFAQKAFPNKNNSVEVLLNEAEKYGISRKIFNQEFTKVVFDDKHDGYLMEIEWEYPNVVFDEMLKKYSR